MGSSKDLAHRLEEVLLNGQWIANTNCKSQIQDLTWQQATQHIGTLNSIAGLTFHLNYYLAGILNVLRGGELLIRDKYSFDLPSIESKGDWDQLKNKFIANSEAFVKEVRQLSDNKLGEAFVDKKYGTVLRNIEGVIEHSYYHLGQITLINKLITEAEQNDD